MTFLSILCALLLEQMKPLRADNPIYAEIKSLALRMETWFNAGHSSHGRLGWFLMMAILMVPTALIYWVLKYYDWFLAAFAWNVLVVYLPLGFRHYSHYFTSIQLHLSAGDEAAARALLAEWTKQDTIGMDVSEISRVAVEKALITTHRSMSGSMSLTSTVEASTSTTLAAFSAGVPRRTPMAPPPADRMMPIALSFQRWAKLRHA